MNNYYEQIRKACIKNKIAKTYEFLGLARQYVVLEDWINECPNIDAFLEAMHIAVGDDLHLEDILLAMGMGYSITCGGLFFAAIPGNGYDRFDKLQITNIRYDLSKSPQDQSEEVLKFICDNIK